MRNAAGLTRSAFESGLRLAQALSIAGLVATAVSTLATVFTVIVIGTYISTINVNINNVRNDVAPHIVPGTVPALSDIDYNARGEIVDWRHASASNTTLPVALLPFYVWEPSMDLNNSRTLIAMSPLMLSANGTMAILPNPVFAGITATSNGLVLGNTGTTTTLLSGTGLATTTVLRLPITNGTNGNVLSTDGSGNLAWVTNGAGVSITAVGPITVGTNGTNAYYVAISSTPAFAGITATSSGLVLGNIGTTTTLLPGTGLATTTVLRLPITNGTSGNVLSTDGAGNLAWVTNGAGVSMTAVGPIIVDTNGTNAFYVAISANPAFASVTATSVKIGATTFTSTGAYSMALPAAAPATGQVLTATSASTSAWSTVAGVINRYYYGTSTTTLANVLVFTSMFGTGTGSLTIPANTLVPGKTIRFYIRGTFTIGAAAGFTWVINLNGTQLSAGTRAGAHAITGFECEGEIFVRSNVLLAAGGMFLYSTLGVPLPSSSTGTFDVAVPQTFDVGMFFLGSNGGNTMSVLSAYIQID